MLDEKLSALLSGWIGDAGGSADHEQQLDGEALARLGSLGYARVAALPSRPLPDPKDRVEIWNLVTRAESLSGRGQHQQAIDLIKPVFREDPNNAKAWYMATLFYKRIQDYANAESCLRQALRLNPRADGFVNLAQFAILRGMDAEADEALKRAFELDPNDGSIAIARGDRHAIRATELGKKGAPGSREEWSRALAEFQTALRVDPWQVGETAREKIKKIEAMFKQ